ncbi:hypothetical protein RN001_003665 [Aquatica leii]|uniref:Regulatory protein zeste n=1 Tax=Aquatica leii TaxID=1421715 RepID=A0AAN7PIP7_9COLE|nr:hypothetical protein RN001_003665 [Aquatica leii]
MAYEKEQAKLEKIMQEMLSEDEDSVFGDVYLSDEYQPESGNESSGPSTLSITHKRRKKNTIPQQSIHDTENQAKRDRSSNWSEEEKLLLVNLITPHKKILENKQKLLSTNKQKEECWKKISDSFASEGYTADRKNLKLTGSGPPPKTETTKLDEIVSGLAPHILIEDTAEFDCDTFNEINTNKESVTTNSATKVVDMWQNITTVETEMEAVNMPNTTDVESDIEMESAEPANQLRLAETKKSSAPLLEEEPITTNKDTPTRNTRVQKKKNKMTAYEREMLKLNKQKIELSMKHMEEQHLLAMMQSKELHELKIQNEKCLIEKKKININ